MIMNINMRILINGRSWITCGTTKARQTTNYMGVQYFQPAVRISKLSCRLYERDREIAHVYSGPSTNIILFAHAGAVHLGR